MIALLIIGLFIILTGVLLFVAPDFVDRVNRYMSKIIFSDDAVFSHRAGVAIVLIVIGLLLVLTYFNYF